MNTVTINISSSLSVQITAARHDFKTDCGVGVTTWFDILAMVGYPPSKSGNTVS